MYQVSNFLHFIFFVDDTNIFYPDKDPGRLVSTLNKELDKLCKLFITNEFSLNCEKSIYMVFSNKK